MNEEKNNNIKVRNEDRKCPSCGRIIPPDARVCPYCAKSFDESVIAIGKKHTGYGTASLVISIVAMCLIWLAFSPFYIFLHLPMGIIAVIFGSLAYWGKNRKDNYGLAGFILGLIVLILGLILMLLSYQYYVTS